MGMIPQEVGTVAPLHIKIPAGKNIAALKRNDLQEDVFVVDNNGAVQTFFEQNNTHWSDDTVQLSQPNFAPPGVPIAVVKRNDVQEDIFVVGNDGVIYTFFEVNSSKWVGPVAISQPNFQPGTLIAAVVRNSGQEDIFATDKTGAIQTFYEYHDSHWIPSLDQPPIYLSPPNFQPGTPIAAVVRNSGQEDIFATDKTGAIQTFYEYHDSHWIPSLDQLPIYLSPPNFQPGTPIAAVVRGTTQEDTFLIDRDGIALTEFEVNNGWSPTAIRLSQQNALPIGMPFNIDVGVPTSMNTMEVADLYDPSGGGLFFADINGHLEPDPSPTHQSTSLAPLQFTLSASEIAGFWVADLVANQTVPLPSLAIGVHHTGDWHQAVDYYLSKHTNDWKFPQIPSWFRDQGAIYGFAGGGGGGPYLAMMDKRVPLKTKIGTFDQLSTLLDEAKNLGTNIVYLWDYWETSNTGNSCAPPDSKPGDDVAYYNKGDYIPRGDGDMGGEAAFKRGIQAIHSLGGKVILYLEPFVACQYSAIGHDKGLQWAGRDPWTLNTPPAPTDPNGQNKLYNQYRTYNMVAAYQPWQQYIVDRATHLVRDDGADGIFLDSWGWQLNWPTKIEDGLDNPLYSSKQYSEGVLQLADRVRKAIQGINPNTPDPVVLGESTSGQLSQFWDGGLSSEFGYGSLQETMTNQGKILASPVRYGFPQINYITNGRDLNELNQIYAAGHNLAVTGGGPTPGGWSPADQAYIKSIIHFRQTYKETLIYGKQRYQPQTGNASIAAYLYEGGAHKIITVVNTASTGYSGALTLQSSENNSVWKDLLTDEYFSMSDLTHLPYKIDGHKLRILMQIM